jgi:hypothetical protein
MSLPVIKKTFVFLTPVYNTKVCCLHMFSLVAPTGKLTCPINVWYQTVSLASVLALKQVPKGLKEIITVKSVVERSGGTVAWDGGAKWNK